MSLKDRSNLPWCCIGDYNDLLAQSEKKGRLQHPNSLIQGFREAIEYCGLCDLGMTGYAFTWEKSRGSDKWVDERLDRALATYQWFHIFENARVVNLEMPTSDHSALLLDFLTGQKKIVRKFRFENAWIKEADCREIVAGSWERNSNEDVQGKLLYCSKELQSWGDKLRTEFRRRINMCRQKVKRLKTKQDVDTIREYKDATEELANLLQKQEDYWKQRVKQFWLTSGDANTKFFHLSASAKRRKNSIDKLKNDQNQWCSWDNGLERTIFDYFNDLFRSRGCNGDFIFSCVKSRVTEEQNSFLTRPFEPVEVKEAIFSMHPDKSHGPDGMNPCFFQQFWDLVGKDVIDAVLFNLNNCLMPTGLNATSIVLIPKTKKPERMSEFRPIALCNVLYKVMAKVVANRLKLVLPSIISDTQSAFIFGRSITDNAMIAFEVGHYLKRKKQGKTGVAAFKVDMSKAYDRIEWNFLRKMLEILGFAQSLVDLIMLLVTTVEFMVSQNGNEVGPIIPSRGLRQGDPISPYLFIICAESLSSLIKHYEGRGLLHGCKIARSAPVISHLFFADDSFFFFKANMEECERIKECFSIYEKASGQLINYQKSSISFSQNVEHQKRQQLCSYLQVNETVDHGKYLGLPSMIGRSKKTIFSFVKDKAWQRIQGWKRKLLSKAGKEILLKIMVQAIPSYAMQVFLLPITLCAEIERMMNSFWWGCKDVNKRGINWLSWEKLSVHKSLGGMGFKRLHDFNLAMLGKQGWKLLTDEGSLIAKIYKAKYFPNCNFLAAELGHNPSYVWRSILATQQLLRNGVCWRIGNGTRVRVWGEPWLPDDHCPYVMSPLRNGLENENVSSLMVEAGNRWDQDILRDLFDERDRNIIERIPLSNIN